MATDATDELYTLKQLFHLGSFREALDEAASLKLKPGAAGEAARRRLRFVLQPSRVSRASTSGANFMSTLVRVPCPSTGAA